MHCTWSVCAGSCHPFFRAMAPSPCARRYSGTPSFRFTFLLSSSFSSLSLSLAPPHQRGQRGRPFAYFFGSSSRVNQRPEEHTLPLLSLSLFFASFVVVVFPFLTAPVFAAVLVQVSWGSTNQEKVESLKRRITADLATV